ncbi:MAG: hypothetical protein BGO39_28945 [Chloroflexi bacterium 54-19]|nr:MAG: hypothetical protein BGO39_28945 [Chloroflexi bacterium 54-19]
MKLKAVAINIQFPLAGTLIRNLLLTAIVLLVKKILSVIIQHLVAQYLSFKFVKGLLKSSPLFFELL